MHRCTDARVSAARAEHTCVSRPASARLRRFGHIALEVYAFTVASGSDREFDRHQSSRVRFERACVIAGRTQGSDCTVSRKTPPTWAAFADPSDRHSQEQQAPAACRSPQRKRSCLMALSARVAGIRARGYAHAATAEHRQKEYADARPGIGGNDRERTCSAGSITRTPRSASWQSTRPARASAPESRTRGTMPAIAAGTADCTKVGADRLCPRRPARVGASGSTWGQRKTGGASAGAAGTGFPQYIPLAATA